MMIGENRLENANFLAFSGSEPEPMSKGPAAETLFANFLAFSGSEPEPMSKGPAAETSFANFLAFSG
jgi:hypothetical protein